MQTLAELRAAVHGRREFFYEVLSRKAGIEAKRAAFRAVERRGRRLTDAGLAGLRRAEERGVADEIRDAKKQFYRGRIERAAGLREEVLERGGVGYGFLDEMHGHRETASEPRNRISFDAGGKTAAIKVFVVVSNDFCHDRIGVKVAGKVVAEDGVRLVSRCIRVRKGREITKDALEQRWFESHHAEIADGGGEDEPARGFRAKRIESREFTHDRQEMLAARGEGRVAGREQVMAKMLGVLETALPEMPLDLERLELGA